MKTDFELIEDYIDYYNDREFVESLTVPEQTLYKCQVKDSLSFICFKLNMRWNEFLKSLKGEKI